MTISYEEALKKSDKNRSLLVGNGFSIAQAGGQFSYSALLEKSGLQPGTPIRQLFDTLATVDFELVMRALQDAAQVENAYGAADRATMFRNDAAAVREALIHAVREVHPGIQFDIPEAQRKQCAAFLGSFENIFTVNYDLLLYWVVLKMGGHIFTDGFGLGETIGGFRTFSEGGACNTFYLHGALHLFLGPKLDTLKRIVTTSTIISDISDTIRARQELPLFVADRVLWADPGKPYERLEPVVRYVDVGAEGEVKRHMRFGQMSKRPEQDVFSAYVRDAYNERCAITDCATPEAIDAAHIQVDEKDRGDEEPRVDDNSIENGILLRADIHALFDAGLISLSEDGKTVDVSERLSDESYAFLKGKKVSPPMYSPPSRENILSHRRRFGFK